MGYNEDMTYENRDSKSNGPVGSYMYVEKSTFPQWIPEHLRSKDLMIKTHDYLEK